MNIFKKILIGFRVRDTRKLFKWQDNYCMSYHDPESLTWSWVINWVPPWRCEKFSLIGRFSFHSQSKMLKKTLRPS